MRGKLMEEMGIQMEQAQLDCTRIGNDCRVAELAVSQGRNNSQSLSRQGKSAATRLKKERERVFGFIEVLGCLCHT